MTDIVVDCRRVMTDDDDVRYEYVRVEGSEKREKAEEEKEEKGLEMGVEGEGVPAEERGEDRKGENEKWERIQEKRDGNEGQSEGLKVNMENVTNPEKGNQVENGENSVNRDAKNFVSKSHTKNTPKKKKPKKRLTLSPKKKPKMPNDEGKKDHFLGKREPISKETSEDEEGSEAPKKPRITKVQRNEKLIAEYRKKILAEVNEEFKNPKNTDGLPLKEQSISFNPICRVLPFAKLIRRSLQDRSRKPETLTKDCNYKSVLKGSSTTFKGTVKYTSSSMFPNRYETQEHDLIDFDQ